MGRRSPRRRKKLRRSALALSPAAGVSDNSFDSFLAATDVKCIDSDGPKTTTGFPALRGGVHSRYCREPFGNYQDTYMQAYGQLDDTKPIEDFTGRRAAIPSSMTGSLTA